MNLPLSLIVLEISPLTACPSDYPCHLPSLHGSHLLLPKACLAKENEEIKETVVNQSPFRKRVKFPRHAKWEAYWLMI